MKFLIALPFLFAAVAAEAVIRIGNGGDAVVCRKDGNVQEATLLDLYESSLKSWALEGPYEQRLESVFKKLEAVSPEQAKIYRRRLKDMRTELDIRGDVGLVDIKDSEHLVVPTRKDCRIEQAAVRRNIAEDDGKRFIVDQHIWARMNDESKAGLVLHEIVYEHLYKLGEENSVKARKLVGYYLSEDFQKTDKNAYWKRVEKLKLPLYR